MSEENTNYKAGVDQKTQDKPLREYVRLGINARVLKNVLSLLSTTTKEAKIVFDKDKASVRTVDPAHVEMIMTELKKEVFQRYDMGTDMPESDGMVTLGVDIDKLLLILKTVKKEDFFNMEYDSTVDPCSFKVTIGSFTHKVNTICIDGMPDPKEPHLELPARFTISTSELKEFLSQAEAVSDHFMIRTERNKVYLRAKSDVNNIEMIPVSISNLTSNSTHKSLYAVDYFTRAVAKLKNLFEYVDICIGSDNPVSIQGHDFKDSGTGFIDVVVLIAPRIESE